MATISTPCIGVCLIDETTRLCAGCGRTLDEIARWSRMPEAERRRIMESIPTRTSPADIPARASERIP